MFPKISKFESLVFSYLSQLTLISNVANVSETHPKVTSDLGTKGKIVIGQVNTLKPTASRYEIDPAYQFTCWDSSYAKARRLSELVIDSIEAWDKPNADGLRVLAPIFETITGSTFSSTSGLYFTSVVYRFPLIRTN